MISLYHQVPFGLVLARPLNIVPLSSIFTHCHLPGDTPQSVDSVGPVPVASRIRLGIQNGSDVDIPGTLSTQSLKSLNPPT